MFILFTNLFLIRPFKLENTLEYYNLREGQEGFTEVYIMLVSSPRPKCKYTRCLGQNRKFILQNTIVPRCPKACQTYITRKILIKIIPKH